MKVWRYTGEIRQQYKDLYNLIDDLEGASDSEMLKILQDEGITR